MKKDDDKKIRLSTGEEIGTTHLTGLETQHLDNLTGFNTNIGEIKSLTFQNSDLATRVLTGAELNKVNFITTQPQSGILGVLEDGTAEYMRSGAVTTRPVEDMFAYGTTRATIDLPTVFPSYGATGPTGPKQLTPEEVEKIIERKMSSNKSKELTMEDVKNAWKELNETTKKQEEVIIIKSLDVVSKKLLENKGMEDWRCKRCGAPLDIFEGEDGLTKIKQYIMSFRNNILKGCKNGHQNFFEIREDGIIWSVITSFDNNFQSKKK